MELYQMPPTWIPKHFTLENYKNIFRGKEFLIYYRNNFIISLITALVTTLLAVLAGYSFSRFQLRGSSILIFLLLSTQMFPVISRLISLYGIFKKMNILNTSLGLILVLTATNLPFCIWLIKGFFDDIPKSIEDAASIDGCSRWGILFKIILPLAQNGLIAIGIYTFLTTWDDYLHCITLISSDHLRTLSAGIAMRYLGELSYDWAQINTISVVGALPMLLLFLFFQKYMIQGLTAGAVKG